MLYLLCDVLAALQVMVSIRKDLRLHNRNNSILENVRRYLCSRAVKYAIKPHFLSPRGHCNTNLLADASVSGQHVSVLKDGQLRGCGFADLQHTTPLGEVCAVFLVLGTTLRQSVQTCTHSDPLEIEMFL